MMRFVFPAICAAIVGASALAAYADVETYEQDSGTALYRSALDGGDPTDLTGGTTGSNISAVATYSVGSAPTVVISARFSVASATATLTVVKGYALNSGAVTWTTQGVTTFTSVAGHATNTISSLYPADDLYVDTSGAAYIKVLATDPSSGTVSIFLRKTSRN